MRVNIAPLIRIDGSLFKRLMAIALIFFFVMEASFCYGCLEDTRQIAKDELKRAQVDLALKTNELALIYVSIFGFESLKAPHEIAKEGFELQLIILEAQGLEDSWAAIVLRKAIKRADRSIEKLEEAIRQSKVKKEEIKHAIRNISQIIKEWQSEIKKINNEIANLEVKIARKKIDISHLKGELESLESQLAGEIDCGKIEELKSKISAKENEISKAEVKLKALHAEHGC